jgi:hypothetical protein
MSAQLTNAQSLTAKTRSLPNFQQLCGRTRLRGHAASGLNTLSPADCQVCCTKVSGIVPHVRVWLRECIVLHCISSDVLSDNRVNVAEEKSERVIWYKVCGPPSSWFTYHMLSRTTLTGKVLDGQRDHRACHRASRWRDRKRRWLTIIAGQREFERVVGDTSAIARVVHPFAIPSLSAKCLHSPHSRASELAVPSSGLAQVLMPHECRASVPSELTPKFTLSISPLTWGVVPLLHRLGCDPHGRAKWAILPDSYLSTRAYSTQCCSVTAIAQCRACKTRPARSTASCALRFHIVTTHPCHCHGTGI